MDVADWTAANGFESIEIACWPRGGRRRPGATPAPATSTSRTCRRARPTRSSARSRPRASSISGLGYYPNPLHPDPAHREQVIGHLKHVITAAEQMDVAARQHVHGRRRARRTRTQNWEDALRVWPDIVAFAERPRPEDHASRTARCSSAYDEWPGGHNIATTPRIWRRILEQWGGTIGLNFDPSHLVLQMIDIPRFIREFGPHILHVQAKDLLIDREGLYERGVFSMGIGWQIPRLPGLGDVDWGGLFGALWRAGYDGDVIIEHEDRDFEKTDDLVKRGFLLARDVLRPYIK